jgi:hypothetical protein
MQVTIFALSQPADAKFGTIITEMCIGTVCAASFSNVKTLRAC